METMEPKAIESKEVARPDNQIVWAAYTASKTREIASRIDEITADLELGETGYSELISILGDAKAVRSMVVERKLETLKKGFDLILLNETNSESLLDLDNIQPLAEALQKHNISDQLIGELTDVAYHEEDEQMMFRLERLAFEHPKVVSPIVIEKIRHNLATWESEINSDPEASITLNKEVLALERKKGEKKDPILESKAMYGLTTNKGKVGEAEPVKHTVNSQNFEAKQDVLKTYLALSQIQAQEQEWTGSMVSVEKSYDVALELIDYFQVGGEEFAADLKAIQDTFEIIKGKLDEVSKKLADQQKRRTKPLKPKDQASEFERVAGILEQTENPYDRTRALSRALVLRFRLAKLQDQHPETQAQTIQWAKETADKLVATISAEDDPIGRIVALEAAANVYDGLGKTAEMLACTNEADELRALHKYRGEKIWA